MLGLLSKIYGRFVANRNTEFDNGMRKSIKVTAPVISVGNIVTGGTGKTPMVQFIVRQLQLAGYSPAVILRGYRRNSRGLRVVHDGSEVVCSVAESGDEAMLHAISLNVPVIVCNHKVDAAVFAAGQINADVIIADDAFQHRALHRDADIVLVNHATYTDALIPKGHLREPVAALLRANVIVNTDTDIIFNYTWHHLGKSERTGVDLRDTTSNGSNNQNDDIWGEQVGKPLTKVIVVSAIANPLRFVNSVREQEVAVADAMLLPDHAKFTSAVVAKMIQVAKENSAEIVTTAKDAVKLIEHVAEFKSSDVNVFVLNLEFSDSEVLRNVMEVITSKINLFKQENNEDRSE
ncbi:MAG: tetraacyldisaccharide 4'-kinase [Ignavibacteria bacterium]|nr:tetraacyldisaccharide 4'-kinase [Ignavibacteria bacterium]